ncbi:MAG: hypothetical protein KIS66_11530 [Fimbriimonadaceae bacterium]|nr:hypothetical protein [Fimbriimonadaceae bacterium]
MRRIVFVAPGLIGSPDAEERATARAETLAKLAARGEVSRLVPEPEATTPEAAWLGVDPARIVIAQGPLVVAAMGADPPDRSVHFHASVLSLHDGCAARPAGSPSEAERTAIVAAAGRLNTRTLTFVAGSGLDHGLVWEDGSLELATTRPDALAGGRIEGRFPEGDGATLLRRFIDDSVNLLDELEFNRRRREEGLPPLNVLWPWGQGVRGRLPNLAIERGEPAWVESRSLRTRGLSRLVGYRPVPLTSGRGLSATLRSSAQGCLERSLTFVVDEMPAALRAESKRDELERWVQEWDREWLAPIFERSLAEPIRLLVVAPANQEAGHDGLALWYESPGRERNAIPFDERGLEDRRVARRTVSDTVEAGCLWQLD